jgi:hypothetical protein
MPDDDPDQPPPTLDYATPGQPPFKSAAALVTIATFAEAWEARLALGKLEADGIPASLADENMVGIGGGLYTNMVGGIKLQVPAADAQRARMLLPARVRGRVTRCPRCGSTDTVEIGYTPTEKILFLLLLGLPYLFVQKRWLCHACTHAWAGPGGDDAEDERPEREDDDDDEAEEDQSNEPKRST